MAAEIERCPVCGQTDFATIQARAGHLSTHSSSRYPLTPEENINQVLLMMESIATYEVFQVSRLGSYHWKAEKTLGGIAYCGIGYSPTLALARCVGEIYRCLEMPDKEVEPL